jgi:hypothetical protein
VMNTGGPETHRPDSCLTSLWRLALIRAGTGRTTLTTVAALVLVWMRRNVLRIRLAGSRTGIAIALLLRGARTLFLFSGRCHVISNLYPSLEATDMPFAEALM